MSTLGTQRPVLVTSLPGPTSSAWIDRLAARECPAITARRARRAQALGAAADDPIVWEEAVGANVVDVDGNILVDMTAGFGVASVGHRNPAVVAAGTAQLAHLPHAMGDAFPDPVRIRLLERLAELSGMDRAILGSSGSDAVEAALKTARIATGRDGVLTFSGSYHGLSYGALSVTRYKAGAFRAPFAGQLGNHTIEADFGGEIPDLSEIGAIIVEPIQGRGGVRVPPDGWLAGLIDAAHAAGAVVIFDEIYTGFGRTGRWLALQGPALNGRRPDLVCVGKGMAGGYPISACLGTAAVMDAWGASRGEALHTQTFLGNPVGCAMALACIAEVERLMPEVEGKGAGLKAALEATGLVVRGAGMLLGVEIERSLAVSRGLMQRGYIALPAGESAEVLALTPPLMIHPDQLTGFLEALADVRAELSV
ncbi:MAG: 4-aminobutyrate aminotransferase/(S)-3-amino-2-methylpropionate transaminase [Myxococcota bacterium]|jgi:4-aminobutyrate aminotransferase/(S)-3-amino-2-methylpropionate transaminase